MSIKCIFVDDEPLALKVLQNFATEFEDLQIVGFFQNPMDAITAIEDQSPDVIFLDINMPKINGLELIKNLTHKPIIIITTAYREYAVESYNMDVLDYLVKPIPFDRFLKSVQKIKQEIRYRRKIAIDSQPRDQAYAFYKVDKKMVKINFKDILYIESLKDYIKIFTTSGYYVVHHSLSGITAELPEHNFLRIHRSYTVAVDKVDTVEGNSLEIGAKRLPIGRKYILETKQTILNPYC